MQTSNNHKMYPCVSSMTCYVIITFEDFLGWGVQIWKSKRYSVNGYGNYIFYFFSSCSY